MLKIAVLLVLLLLAVAFVESVKQQPKIIIVGAGLSGLSAASKLIENGFENILILEAEDRIGGRIHSVELGNGGYIDLGGQWVHGQEKNSIYEIVNGKYDFGVTGFDDYFPQFVRSSGKALDQKVCQKYSESAMKILFSSYDEMSKFPGSIKDYFVKRFTKEMLKGKESEPFVTAFIDFYEKEMNIWNGSTTWDDLSAELHCVSGSNPGKQHLTWKRDGFKKFFDFLLTNDDILKSILFNKKVANVQWNPRYYNKMAIITTTDGHKYFADHIIFTVSLGVLKNHYRTLFSPQLPKFLISSIHAMGYGSIGKVFLEFKEPFWPKDADWVGYGLLWTKSDKAKIQGTDREWLLDIQLFAKLDNFPNVLEALLAGPNMKAFETMSDSQLIEDCMWLLQKFLAIPLPKPITMKRTKWLTNPNFLGSYSYHSMDATKFNVTSKDLGQTLYNLKQKPEILFAGEHTDELYSSNAHGAVNSGFKAANELIKYYSKL